MRWRAFSGSSVGVSLTFAYVVRETQANHAVLGEPRIAFNEALRHLPLPEAWSFVETTGVAALNAEATRQAAAIAYNGDFGWLAMASLVCYSPAHIRPVCRPATESRMSHRGTRCARTIGYPELFGVLAAIIRGGKVSYLGTHAPRLSHSPLPPPNNPRQVRRSAWPRSARRHGHRVNRRPYPLDPR